MSGDWVNRIGIILNFCAGFLLAPELIGIQRLQRFEKFLEERMSRFRDIVDMILPGVVVGAWAARDAAFLIALIAGNRARWVVGSLAFLSLVLSLGSLILWALFLWAAVFVFELSVQAIAAIAVFSIAVPFVALCVSTMRQSQPLRAIRTVSSVILSVEFGFLLMPLMILGTLCLGLLLVGSQLLSRTLGFVIARLTGNDKLKGVVVFSGIAVFIVGNVLQLLATWP